MDNYEITWYMHELAMHSWGVDREFRALEAAIADSYTVQTRIVWFHLTSFLSHASMISKYLDPIRKNKIQKQRMDVLRKKLGVDRHCHILSRDARDNVEHFDERIDNWVGQGKQAVLEVVLPDRAGYDFLAADGKRIKRVLLAAEMVFVSEKRDGCKLEFKLRPLAADAKKIGDNATRWIVDESPYHFIFPQKGG